jgi:hypothetical protein
VGVVMGERPGSPAFKHTWPIDHLPADRGMIRRTPVKQRSLPNSGARYDHVELDVDARPCEPSLDNGAVQHGFQQVIVLRPLDQCDERVGGVIGDHLIPCFKLSDDAILENISVENGCGKVAGHVAAGDASEERKCGPYRPRKSRGKLVAGDRIELSTLRFSVVCSTN